MRFGSKSLFSHARIAGIKYQAHRVGRFAQKSGNIEMALAPIVSFAGAPEVGAGLEAAGAVSRKVGVALKSL
jgi:hypothetical protein